MNGEGGGGGVSECTSLEGNGPAFRRGRCIDGDGRRGRFERRGSVELRGVEGELRKREEHRAEKRRKGVSMQRVQRAPCYLFTPQYYARRQVPMPKLACCSIASQSLLHAMPWPQPPTLPRIQHA